MADLVYRSVMRDIKQKILGNEYPGMRLPDERSLSEIYEVSRSSIKRALGVLAQEGIIFKKRGSGTFINPLYLKISPYFIMKGVIWELRIVSVLMGRSKELSCLITRLFPQIRMYKKSCSSMIMTLYTKSNGYG